MDDSNAQFKKAGYDRKTEELQRKLNQLEYQRKDFQHRLESAHHGWTCKLQVFVTDMNEQSEKTQADLKQIQDLLASMAAVSDK